MEPAMSTAPASTTKPAPRSYLVTWFAVIFGAGIALAFNLFSTGKRSEGYAELSHNQRGPMLRFDLPTGWWTSYNGRQHWRGGTIIDSAGRPRIEVWIFDGDCPWQGVEEDCVFPWGPAACRTAAKTMSRPFTSLPHGDRSEVNVIERAFLLKDGYLLFRVHASQDRDLRPMIWDCMRSLRSS
jgi:hypothetical protein